MGRRNTTTRMRDHDEEGEDHDEDEDHDEEGEDHDEEDEDHDEEGEDHDEEDEDHDEEGEDHDEDEDHDEEGEDHDEEDEDHDEEGEDHDEEDEDHDEEGEDHDEEDEDHDEEGEDHDEEDEDHDEEGEDHDEDEDHDEEGEDHDEDEDHDEEGEEHGHDDEEEIDRILLDSRRRNVRFTGGLKDLGTAIDEFVLKLSMTDWNHKEIEFFEDGAQIVGTVFDQQEIVYRGVFEQKKVGPLSGRFGFWGLDREYSAVGEEALSPPIDQTGFALYALEELDFETARFQFGGRLETQRYRPGFGERGGGHADEENGQEEEDHEAEEGEEVPEAVRRTFTGASASAGLQVDTWSGGALVVNYSHSFRAPSLEELYNYGPHAGTLSFEIGDPALRPETGDGIEMSLRHNSPNLRGELNLFYYNFDNFIFPFAPGAVEDGLPVIEFTQLNARFLGYRGQPRHQPESPSSGSTSAWTTWTPRRPTSIHRCRESLRFGASWGSTSTTWASGSPLS